MLEKLRNRQIHLYSTFVIIFAILVKILVPIAHASNASVSGETSFLATICSGTKIVFIDLDLAKKSEQTPKTTIADSQCSLCSITEQDHPSHGIAQALFFPVKNVNPSPVFYGGTFNDELASLRAIRAPPILS